MTTVNTNIYPEFTRMLGREEKEKFLNQHGLVIWLYGLSGSGKSTIANSLERRLASESIFTKILDGDNIRSRINSDLGFSDEDRVENIRRVSEIARLFYETGIVTLTSFITPNDNLRSQAKKIIGAENFIEVFVKCSFEVCMQRDVKGLYAKANDGNVKNFTGKDSGFEEPADPDIVLNTEIESLEESVDKLYSFIKPKIQYNA